MVREVIWPNGPEPDALLAPAVRVGNLVFTAGIVGRDPTSNHLVADDIRAQSRQTLANIRAILEAAGSSMDQIVKATCFVADIAERPIFNEVYREFIPPDRPARTCVQAGRLGEGIRVEVEVIAVVPGT